MKMTDKDTLSLPSRMTSWLNLNRICNLRCNWCYAKTTQKDEVIELQTLRQIIKLLKELPVRNVILIGGEPTLHPYFLEIVQLLSKAGLRVLLVTNSLKFRDKNFLEEAIKNGLTGVVTSLKAGSDEQYQKLTGRQAFTTVMEAIDNLNRTSVFHRISITLCSGILENIDSVIRAVLKSKVKSFALSTEKPIVNINGQTYPLKNSPQEIAQFLVNLYPRLTKSAVPFFFNISLPFCLFPRWFIERLIENDRLTSGCQIFNGSGVIFDQKANLLPCNHFCDNPLGTLGVDFTTADEYWRFRKRQDIVNFYKIISACPHQQCVNCDYWQLCGGGCRVYWLHYGSEELINQKRG